MNLSYDKILNQSYHIENMNFTGEITDIGPKEGVYKTYYTNKNIKSLESYVNGKLHGLSQNYDIYGNILSEYPYKDGLLNGTVKIYHNPKIDTYITIREPKIHKTIVYQNNVKIGLEKIYLEDGTLFITYDHSFVHF
jgi:antitoxin component YwqK of YwqJK toxin-antitoxin module